LAPDDEERAPLATATRREMTNIIKLNLGSYTLTNSVDTNLGLIVQEFEAKLTSGFRIIQHASIVSISDRKSAAKSAIMKFGSVHEDSKQSNHRGSRLFPLHLLSLPVVARWQRGGKIEIWKEILEFRLVKDRNSRTVIIQFDLDRRICHPKTVNQVLVKQLSRIPP